MSEKMKALDELAKKMNELKADKYKSRKSKMSEEEYVCEDEECEDESHDHKKPELEIEVVELGEMGDEGTEEEKGGKKSFSQILAEVAKSKGKKH